MREIEQILQYQCRIGAFLVKPVELRQGRRRIAAQYHFEQVEYLPAVGDTEHVAHRCFCDLATRQGDSLVK